MSFESFLNLTLIDYLSLKPTLFIPFLNWMAFPCKLKALDTPRKFMVYKQPTSGSQHAMVDFIIPKTAVMVI